MPPPVFHLLNFRWYPGGLQQEGQREPVPSAGACLNLWNPSILHQSLAQNDTSTPPPPTLSLQKNKIVKDNDPALVYSFGLSS